MQYDKCELPQARPNYLSVIVRYSFNASRVRVLNSVRAYDTRKKTM